VCQSVFSIHCGPLIVVFPQRGYRIKPTILNKTTHHQQSKKFKSFRFAWPGESIGDRSDRSKKGEGRARAVVPAGMVHRHRPRRAQGVAVRFIRGGQTVLHALCRARRGSHIRKIGLDLTYSVCCDILFDVVDILFSAVSIYFFRHTFASVLTYF
jgi:hypothetical protein